MQELTLQQLVDLQAAQGLSLPPDSQITFSYEDKRKTIYFSNTVEYLLSGVAFSRDHFPEDTAFLYNTVLWFQTAGKSYRYKIATTRFDFLLSKLRELLAPVSQPVSKKNAGRGTRFLLQRENGVLSPDAAQFYDCLEQHLWLDKSSSYYAAFCTMEGLAQMSVSDADVPVGSLDFTEACLALAAGTPEAHIRPINIPPQLCGDAYLQRPVWRFTKDGLLQYLEKCDPEGSKIVRSIAEVWACTGLERPFTGTERERAGKLAASGCFRVSALENAKRLTIQNTGHMVVPYFLAILEKWQDTQKFWVDYEKHGAGKQILSGDRLWIKSDARCKDFSMVEYAGTLLNHPDLLPDIPLFVSKEIPQKICTEWRVFVYHKNIMDVRCYSADLKKASSFLSPSLLRIRDYIRQWDGIPDACTLDVAVLQDGQTELIEAHNLIACGLYGFNSASLPHMVRTAYMQELKNLPH